MASKNIHGWKRREEDGLRVEIRARFFGKQWTFRRRSREESEFTPIEEPTVEDFKQLYEMLFAKYQRKHLSWDHLQSARAEVEARGGSVDSDDSDE